MVSQILAEEKTQWFIPPNELEVDFVNGQLGKASRAINCAAS